MDRSVSRNLKPFTAKKFMNSVYTSAKIIQLNEWGCRDGIHHAKNRGNKVIPLAILSRILAQSCVTPLP